MSKHFFVLLIFLAGCSGLEESERVRLRKMNAKGEFIYRSAGEKRYETNPPKKVARAPYPWEEGLVGSQAKITKEFFRCRGNLGHKPIVAQSGAHLFDCGGSEQHSLPLKEGKEFIYPILPELLNYVQERLEKKVIITCGHRCPTHNAYSDGAPWNQTSKHMIGAEVDFYVEGMEYQPEAVIALLMEYYQERSPHKEKAAYHTFERWNRPTNVSTPPWYNKEIFIKLFQENEGRDFDNTHEKPYIAIQVRIDAATNSPVTYTWSKAFNGYLRY
jgi:hypothetical protein